MRLGAIDPAGLASGGTPPAIPMSEPAMGWGIPVGTPVRGDNLVIGIGIENGNGSSYADGSDGHHSLYRAFDRGGHGLRSRPWLVSLVVV
jgi:hypothetical protein